MTIDYWTNFSKRKNSTKQPSSGTSLTVTLKEGTSIEKPVFLISGDHFDICYVKAFTNHYYFVDDIKSVRNGLTEVSCSMDPMATFKSTIGSYEAFVERSSYDYNQWIPDPACSILPYAQIDESSVSSGLNATGCFAVSVLNTIGSGVGFTTTYLMDRTNLRALANYCNTDWGSLITDPLAIVEWMQAVFLKTANSIIDCIWLPIDYSSVSSLPNVSFETVTVGVDSVPSCSGYRMTGVNIKNFTIIGLSFPTPQHPTDFRHYPPYTIYKLYVPGYGSIETPYNDFPSGMQIDMDVDMSTGDTMVYLNSGTKLVSTLHYNIGVSCPVGKVGSDVTGTAVGIIQARANLVSADVPGNKYSDVSRLEAAASGVNAFSTFAGVTPSVSGSKGGRALITNGLNFILSMWSHNTITPADYYPTSGLMLLEKRTLSSIPGYIKCINASVPISGMNQDRDTINNYLNSGFYYE